MVHVEPSPERGSKKDIIKGWLNWAIDVIWPEGTEEEPQPIVTWVSPHKECDAIIKLLGKLTKARSIEVKERVVVAKQYQEHQPLLEQLP